MATILLVDDDKEVLQINSKYLSQEGYTVLATSDPLKGVAAAKSKNPDCIILDVMMPGMDGYEVCRRIRQFSQVPILFLTGKVSEDDKINGLLTGADDYITKPYSLKELAVRIQVILRRSIPQNAATNANVLTFGSLRIDKLAHKAFFLEEDLELTNREYEVLMYFAEHPGEEVSFEQLGQCLFGTYQEADRRLVRVNVSRLRKKMSIDPELENMLETVWSKGYRFITHS